MYFGQLVDDTESIIGIVSGSYISKEEAFEAIDNVFGFIHEKFSGEGIFLIEHILLRPKRRDIPSSGGPISDELLEGIPNTLDGYINPYSFCVSIVLPSGLTDTDPPELTKPERFGDNDFRNLAEKIIRREFPSHVKVGIYWLNRPEIMAFEPIYRTWLESLADSATSDEDLVLAQNDLMDQLKTIIANA